MWQCGSAPLRSFILLYGTFSPKMTFRLALLRFACCLTSISSTEEELSAYLFSACCPNRVSITYLFVGLIGGVRLKDYYFYVAQLSSVGANHRGACVARVVNVHIEWSTKCGNWVKRTRPLTLSRQTKQPNKSFWPVLLPVYPFFPCPFSI